MQKIIKENQLIGVRLSRGAAIALLLQDWLSRYAVSVENVSASFTDYTLQSPTGFASRDLESIYMLLTDPENTPQARIDELAYRGYQVY